MNYLLLKNVATDIKFFETLYSSPSNHYKVFKIPKRSIGFRIIAQPTKNVKDYQRKIVRVLEPLTAIHSAATAYKKNQGIKDNAFIHKNSEFLLKLDLVNFFNSITPEMFFNALNVQKIKYSENDRMAMSEYLFWNINERRADNKKLVLSVGAPSSPFISNFVMFAFDKKISQFCLANSINYSRYADDLTFSTKDKNVLFNVISEVQTTLKACFGHKLKINTSKTIFSSKAHNRHVTGITLTNNNQLSIGRERKRYISALVHKASLNMLPKEDIHHLQGLISFARHIEPTFIQRLERRYGKDIIHNIINTDLDKF
ncbi:retron St85 family RNA-directed DNA polymerase [Pseudoalteromonas luteoviolacea]|uniref:retron St85 family RNA-directed DNA polymerase n=1 Tax=Pseudoalteromonas luteoviolacea TaxID=43657 RepID=UPI001B3A50B2|nr:retron St85 family RNA-directed DNA polymerase [Pseudoalteromonas luteoviolacea]MBQ4876270.1 retron St85 family RNA-directed DNA polymerase [Pseudoalteromonas luteoviolacea]MBQ4906304.1 retron St85 family RNA-directed DNA polymerase [Pseudoalteromonas luteoviolacea]